MKAIVTQQMIDFWIEKKGSLLLDTPDKHIIDFFKSNGKISPPPTLKKKRLIQQEKKIPYISKTSKGLENPYKMRDDSERWLEEIDVTKEKERLIDDILNTQFPSND